MKAMKKRPGGRRKNPLEPLLERQRIEVARSVLHPETGAYREVLRVRREAEA